MRRNKSFKENSFARSRGSRGKEISIQLDRPNKPTATPLQDYSVPSSRGTTDRLNASQSHNAPYWQQNPSISHNILKEIINYSNISQSTRRGNTIAVFDKGENVLSQLAKINKKAGENPKKEAKRLTLDFVESRQQREEREGLVQMSKSVALLESKQFTGEESILACRSASINQLGEEERTRLELERSQTAAYLEQLTILQESIQNEHSQMIPYWESMLNCENIISRLQAFTQRLQNSLSSRRTRIEQLNLALLANNRQFLASRNEWDARGSGVRTQVVEEAQIAHEQFIRKVTVRDFSETVLFNMKVAIPEYKGKTSIRGIYEQLFRSRSAKKFTMILKKHSAHMDLYDGRLLADFIKRINDLEAMFLRADADARHPDNHFLQLMAQLVTDLDAERSGLEREEAEEEHAKGQLAAAREEQRACEHSIHKLIDEINSQVRGQYERETDREADFKALLLTKTISKYRQFRSIREKKMKAGEELQHLQEKLNGTTFCSP